MRILALTAALLACIHAVVAVPTAPQFPLMTLKSGLKSAPVTEQDVLASPDAFTTLSLPSLPGYKVRVKPVTKLCDPSVVQHAGYLDVGDDKHFFFWFFESRVAPEKAPVTLWLNGGPGCSSMTGLMMELGPCRPTVGGEKTEPNPYSWSNISSMIFLDQPINVGFSYSDDGQDPATDTTQAAKDCYAFLLLFFSTFKKYQPLDFHVFGESYAGHYIPAVGAVIIEGNKDAASEGFPVIKLKTLGIGNGMVDPLVQYEYYPQMACDPPGYEPVIKDPEVCNTMESKVGTCTNLISGCYKFQSAFTCLPGSFYCNSALLSPYTNTGFNPYDVRAKCSEGNSLCYDIMNDIEAYLNKPEIHAALGTGDIEFKSCNMKINQEFLMKGDWMRPFVRLLAPMLDGKGDAGVRILIYAGDADFICNWLGNKAWTLGMEWSGKAEFNDAVTDLPWTTDAGKKAGEYRTFGPLTFVRVKGAGHMVPYDQPESAYDMFESWLSQGKFSKPSTAPKKGKP